MKAVEFETYIKRRLIHLPMRLRYLDNVKTKVILLYSESEKQSNYDKKALLLAFSKAQQKGVFNKMNNSVIWQKQMRDEWE
jgi:hypothetical protein